MTSVTVAVPIRRSKPKAILRPVRSIDATRRGDRTSWQIALAYRIERDIETGTLRDFAHAAEVFGITRARVSQIVALMNLAPDIQARLLAGDTNIHERTLRAALRFVDWNQQRATLEGRRQ